MKVPNFVIRLQVLWKDTGTGGASFAEPSEARFRNWVLAVGMLVVPPLLLLFYYKTMFPGLTNPLALDFAQLGRNMSSGKGFITYIVRPLTLMPERAVTAQPDTTHGPLFPFLLAMAFSALGAKDTVVAMVSGLFYLLTIPLIYTLGVRIFDRGVGLATALIFTFNSLMLEYAASGLHITLFTMLMTGLLLVTYDLASWRTKPADKRTNKLPISGLILAGVLTGLLYLTDPIFIWISPVMLIAVTTLFPEKRVNALVCTLVPLCLLILPWMWRNGVLTGNPVFGYRGMEVWMFTKGFYPGFSAYRMSRSELIPGVPLFQAVVQKMLFGLGTVIQTFPQVTASWVLAFFLPCLLFRFTDQASNTVRRVLLYFLAALFVGTVVFSVEMPIFVALIPVMLAFSVGYLLYLIKEARLGRSQLVVASLLLAMAVVFPLISDMTLIDKTPAVVAMSAARNLRAKSQPGEACITDQPAVTAWYADRPSILIPVADANLSRLRAQFPSIHWLFLTKEASSLSPGWQYVYDGFWRWNSMYIDAKQTHQAVPGRITISDRGGKTLPILQGLSGFASVDPVEGLPTSVVFASTLTSPTRVAESAQHSR